MRLHSSLRVGRSAACRGFAGGDGVGSRTASGAWQRSNGSPARRVPSDVGRADPCAFARRPGSKSTKQGMRANLDFTHGLIASEAVMMGLAPHLGRGHARDLVQALCMKAIEAASTAVSTFLPRRPRSRAPCRRRRLAQAMRSSAISRFVRGDGGSSIGQIGGLKLTLRYFFQQGEDSLEALAATAGAAAR